MSDATRQNLKISREGIVLIKSLEGFRPRALKRGNQWVVGYGHTVSAREGASVSEQEAELLLRYDLLPVEAVVNAAATAPLNQHQFDALASFAHSVGIDEFKASKVLRRLNAGETAQAADALMAWPDKPTPEAPVRRRSAERALFLADPTAPTTVAELMTAPLPPVEEDGTVLPFPVADELVASAPDVVEAAAPDATEPAPFPTSADPVAADPVAADPVAATTPDPVVPETPSQPTPATAIPADSRGPVLRHEDRIRIDQPFEWTQALPYMLIGGAGFIGFGVAMGTLRLSAMPSARSGEIALSGWLLAILSIGFIGYAGWKLYDRWGRSDPR